MAGDSNSDDTPFLCGSKGLTTVVVAITALIGAVYAAKVALDKFNKPPKDTTVASSAAPTDPIVSSATSEAVQHSSSPELTQTAARVVNTDVEAASLEIGMCFGQGGVATIQFWGPTGTPRCNGIAGWHGYELTKEMVTSIGWCIGRDHVLGVRLYGPPGRDCGGHSEWGTYRNPTKISAASLGWCYGKGNMLNDQVLWGPKDEICGGEAGWLDPTGSPERYG